MATIEAILKKNYHYFFTNQILGAVAADLLYKSMPGLCLIISRAASGQSYKQFTLIIYNSRVVIWGIFQSGTTLES